MLRVSKKAPLISNAVPSELEDLKAELKKARKTIAELEGIKSSMPDPYYIRDMDYNIILWSKSMAKLTGYTEEEAKRLKCYEIFKAGVCPPGAQCPTQHCVTVKQFLKDVAVDVYNKNGETIHSLVSNAGVYDERGNPIGAVEVLKNNTIIQETLQSIGETIKEIDIASDSLNTAMDKVQNFSQRVNENSSESLNSITKSVETGNHVSAKAGESSTHAGSVQKNMKNINESMRFSIDKIYALKTKSELIIEFIKVIQDIAAKTNLLAINASIEAAHAGESGRGFKVVADGIRELSKNSQESALSIQSTIQEIGSLTNDVTASMNVTEGDIESGVKTISGLLSFVNEIAASIEELMYALRTIENSAGMTLEVIGEQNKSVVEVSNVGHKLAEISRKLSREFDIVSRAVHHTDMG